MVRTKHLNSIFHQFQGEKLSLNLFLEVYELYHQLNKWDLVEHPYNSKNSLCDKSYVEHLMCPISNHFQMNLHVELLKKHIHIHHLDSLDLLHIEMIVENLNLMSA
jgi:hypothetical protein